LQKIRRSGGRRLGRSWPENEPKRHRRIIIWNLSAIAGILKEHF
jgi:hypothetical protein